MGPAYCPGRREQDGFEVEQARRLGDLRKETTRLRRVVAAPTLRERILAEAINGEFYLVPCAGLA